MKERSMGTGRKYQPLEFEVPQGWIDRSTVVVAPSPAGTSTGTASINMVVKRRPVRGDVATTLREYLVFMARSFGHLDGLKAREVKMGGQVGYAIKFGAKSAGKPFRQTTLFFVAGNEEVSASVTQLESDPTPESEIEKLLTSVRSVPAAPNLW
jgi:hypothetical protein